MTATNCVRSTNGRDNALGTRHDEAEPPRGECQCGCGEKTRLAPCASRRNGWVKGEPLRYIRGHNRRKRHQYVVTPTGYKTECWLWLLCKDEKGYGRVRVAPRKIALAHRVYYEHHAGSIGDELELDHLCRVRGCVNPDHLEPVTRHENLRRSGKLKLRHREVLEIRRSAETQHVIARRFGITQSQVSRIKARLVWRGLPDP